MKLIKVKWVDSSSPIDIWWPKDDYPEELSECESVGWLIKKTKEKTIICQSRNDYQYGRVFVIPTSLIKEIKYL